MKSILLVEDSPEDVFFMQRALKKATILNPLHIAEDGKRATEYLEGSGVYANRLVYPLPSMVLLDLKLPFIKGLDVLKWMRERPEMNKIVVIIFTSSALDKDIDDAYELGANSYSIKPSSSDRLATFAQALHGFWLQHDRACAEPIG